MLPQGSPADAWLMLLKLQACLIPSEHENNPAVESGCLMEMPDSDCCINLEGMLLPGLEHYLQPLAACALYHTGRRNCKCDKTIYKNLAVAAGGLAALHECLSIEAFSDYWALGNDKNRQGFLKVINVQSSC